MSPFSAAFRPSCGTTYGVDEVRVACEACGSLLDVAYDWDRLQPAHVARFLRAEVVAAPRAAVRSAASGGFTSCCRSPRREQVVTIGEGQTLLQPSRRRRPSTSACSRASCFCNTRG